ncbi:hypothetical protein [Leifsonia shinshuensis]|uniref:Preprotein translocase subunit SecG n=1 Tax=Leifsonia shinshuensis TaxID=150026 RepID=A0A853CVL3_9MICO|nr:hypothetical protein [Leifsonia shinshuensis]NYJ24462.1 preprotein translocase subunit SecG [Leifsonia shinshuensis]
MSTQQAEAHIRSTRTLMFAAGVVLIVATIVGAVLSVAVFISAGSAAGNAASSKSEAISARRHVTDAKGSEAAMQAQYQAALAALQVYTDKYGAAGLMLIQQATAGSNPPAALLTERKRFEAANQAVESGYGNLNSAKDDVTRAQADAAQAAARASGDASSAEAALACAWITVGVSLLVVAVLVLVFLFTRTKYLAARACAAETTSEG